ncbi:hypothetical protein [Salinibius halmophilus]|uniref:hypothetical protein n=1 Tax=Salinibius halmophilus TaxID=1853216 RepID=UPI000E667E8C|nr:hypothetical protein [Salinibius halmophilus]
MNNGAFKLVKSELIQSLQSAESSFDAFVSDHTDLESLSDCSATMNRLRGTFALMEDIGVSKLCAAISQSVEALSTQSDNSRLIQACSHAILVVGRYVEYREFGDPIHPDLMLEEINRLRLASGERVHPLDWFNPVAIRQEWFSQITVSISDQDNLARLKRVHLLTQAGLVQVTKKERLTAVFKAMAELFERAGRAQKDSSLSSMFTVMAQLCESLSLTQPFINNDRLRLFAQFERTLSNLLQTGTLGSGQVNDLKRQIVYLLSLQPVRSEACNKLLTALGVQRATTDDAKLAEEYRLLHGPGASVLTSVSDALLEELSDIREHIEQAERSKTAINLDIQAPRMAGVAEALAMVGLSSAANVVKQVLHKLKNAADIQDPALLANVADGFIYAETAAARLKSGTRDSGAESPNQASAQAVHDHARIALIDEAEQGLAVIKRAISAYMDHDGDKLHLTNIDVSLRGVRGACVFLGAERAVKVVDMISRFVNERLLAQGEEISQAQFDQMAESLSGLEFYLEALLTRSARADEVLNMAEKNISRLF